METVQLDPATDYVFHHQSRDTGGVAKDLCPWCRRWFVPRHDAAGDYSAELGRPCPICPFPDGDSWTLPQRVVRYLRNAIVPGPHANPHDRAHFARVVRWARTGDYLP